MLRRVLTVVVGVIVMFTCSAVTARADGVFDAEGNRAHEQNGKVKVTAGQQRRESGQSGERSSSQGQRGDPGGNSTGEGSGSWCEPVPGLPRDCAWAVPQERGGNISGVDPRMVGVRVATEIRLPALRPVVGPNPEKNQWRMIPVGYPIWLWTEGASVITSSAASQGVTVSLRAVPGLTVFTMGDGALVRCEQIQPRPASVTGAVRSPVCGYTYSKVPRGGSTYTITATTTWTVHWTAASVSGTLTVTRAGSMSLTVGELQAVIER